jgi:hypothetical protein
MEESSEIKEDKKRKKYDVEKILDISKKAGKTLLKVQWANYPLSEATWEPPCQKRHGSQQV